MKTSTRTTSLQEYWLQSQQSMTTHYHIISSSKFNVCAGLASASSVISFSYPLQLWITLSIYITLLSCCTVSRNTSCSYLFQHRVTLADCVWTCWNGLLYCKVVQLTRCRHCVYTLSVLVTCNYLKTAAEVHIGCHHAKSWRLNHDRATNNRFPGNMTVWWWKPFYTWIIDWDSLTGC